MDTGPAAAGALEEAAVGGRRRGGGALAVNVGNFQTRLAFHLAGGAVAGLFEHHTGELTDPIGPRCGAAGVGGADKRRGFESPGARRADAGGGGPAATVRSHRAAPPETGRRGHRMAATRPGASRRHDADGLLRAAGALAHHWPPAREPVEAALGPGFRRLRAICCTQTRKGSRPNASVPVRAAPAQNHLPGGCGRLVRGEVGEHVGHIGGEVVEGARLVVRAKRCAVDVLEENGSSGVVEAGRLSKISGLACRPSCFSVRISQYLFQRAEAAGQGRERRRPAPP